MNTVINLQGPQKARNFLTNSETITFLRTLLHEVRITGLL